MKLNRRLYFEYPKFWREFAAAGDRHQTTRMKERKKERKKKSQFGDI